MQTIFLPNGELEPKIICLNNNFHCKFVCNDNLDNFSKNSCFGKLLFNLSGLEKLVANIQLKYRLPLSINNQYLLEFQMVLD